MLAILSSTVTQQHESISPYEPGEIPIERTWLDKLRSVSGVASTIGVSFGVFGFFAIQGIILARMLGPIGRGEFAVANLYAQALMYIGLLGAPELFARLAANHENEVEVRRAAGRYGIFAGLVTATACIVLSFLTTSNSQQYLLPMAFVCAAATAAQQIRLSVQAIDHGRRQMLRYNVCRMIAAALFPIVLLAVWSTGRSSVPTACWTLLICSVATVALCQWGMNGSWLGRPAIGLLDSLKMAKSITGSVAINELMERLDLVLIVWFLSSTKLEIVGAYAAAIPVAGVMMIIPNAAALYIFNRAARAHETPTQSEMWTAIGGLVALQVSFGILLAVAIPFLLPFMYGERFESAIMFAEVLIPAAALRGLLQSADAYLRARGRSTVSIPPRFVGVAIILVTSFVGWSWLGPYAVPLGLTLAQLYCFFAVLSKVQRDISQNSPAPTV